MIKQLNILFVTFFKIGKIKFAPGTVASLVTCVCFLLLIKVFSFFVLFLLIFIIAFYSLIAINNSFDLFKSSDPQEIVIDEVVGQMIPLLAIPIYETLFLVPKEYYCIVCFLLFRLFDIWKPFPISYIDKNSEGALGIMLDDVVAGLFSTFLIILISFYLGG